MKNRSKNQKNRIGVVGGGQLGKMMGLEAKKMGFWVGVADPTDNSPAGQVVDYQIVADYQDEKAIRKLAEKVDFLTFEIELANAEVLDELAEQGVSINPSPKTLDIIKDKLKQKSFLDKHGIGVADFCDVKTKSDVVKAGESFGYPLLLKARTDAYDGRGNVLIQDQSEIDAAMKRLKGRKLYAERYVPFVKELAVMVARSTDGEIRTYPVVETIHKDNICHTVIAPALIEDDIYDQAQQFAEKVMEKLSGAGVFGIEMFLTKDHQILVNEIAPRVHNSGHYTIEGCTTSQFEQHIRAISGLPLGSTDMVVPVAVMVNILGDRTGPAEVQGLKDALALGDVSVHIYGKHDTKPGRKMGHMTAVGGDYDSVMKLAKKARACISI